MLHYLKDVFIIFILLVISIFSYTKSVPCVEANLHKPQVKIILPYSILQENLTIRAIHFLFDPFSENAKSYRQDVKDTVEDLTAGIPGKLYIKINHFSFKQCERN